MENESNLESKKHIFYKYLTKISMYDMEDIVALKKDMEKCFYVISARRQIATLNPYYDPQSKRPTIKTMESEEIDFDYFPDNSNNSDLFNPPPSWNKYNYKEELELTPFTDFFYGVKTTSFYVDPSKVDLIFLDDKMLRNLFKFKRNHLDLKHKYENSVNALENLIKETLDNSENIILR